MRQYIPLMMSSVLQAAEAVAEQEVRSDHGQDGAQRGPGQAVRLIHVHAAGSQRPQGAATAFPATVWRHENDAERAVRHAEPLPHLAELSWETLRSKNVYYP